GNQRGGGTKTGWQRRVRSLRPIHGITGTDRDRPASGLQQGFTRRAFRRYPADDDRESRTTGPRKSQNARREPSGAGRYLLCLRQMDPFGGGEKEFGDRK